MSLGITPLELSYLLAYTSDGVFLNILESQRHKLLITHGLIRMTLNLHGYEAFPMAGPSLTLGSHGPSHHWWCNTSPGCHSGVPLVPMVFRTLLMKKCATYCDSLAICWRATLVISRGTPGVPNVSWTTIYQHYLNIGSWHMLVVLAFNQGCKHVYLLQHGVYSSIWVISKPRNGHKCLVCLVI